MKPWQRTIPILVVLMTILSLLLTACGPIENQHGGPNSGKDRVNGKGPDQQKHKDKGNVQHSETGSQAGKLLICHRTGSAKKPYVQISVANDALKDGHGSHAGDLIPAPADGCPKTVTAP